MAGLTAREIIGHDFHGKFIDQEAMARQLTDRLFND